MVFTGEQYGDSTQLLFLRARYYNPADGRFQSRDTWSGDVNRPMSFNKWIYAYQNPINLLDPTGMKPQESENWKYCSGLSGLDWKYCSNIVRGLHPETPMTVADYFLFDEYGPCYLPQLAEKLPKSLGVLDHPTYKEYGWWWHYLLDQTPGWWNNGGKGHIYFKDVLVFAVAAELSNMWTYSDLVGYAAGAMANKGRSDGSFYKMIGSRQSVYWRVNNAVYGKMSPKNGTDFNYAQFGSMFGDTIPGSASNIRNWGDKIMSNTGFTHDQTLAYEWGVYNDYARTHFPYLAKAMGDPVGIEREQVLWRSGDGLAFVVTQDQLLYLCEKKSCVAEEVK